MTDTIKSVVAVINGATLTLTYNSESGKYEATGVAPTASSFPLDGGYYPVTVTATYETGETTSVSDQTEGDIGENCKFIVKERVKPQIKINYPTNGQYITKAEDQFLDITLLDNVGQESGFSGVDLDSFSIEITEDQTLRADDFEVVEIDGGYRLTYTPPAEKILSDGHYTFTANVSDNDGNAADAVAVSCVCDSTPPELSVTSPVDGLATASSTLTVEGSTNDATSVPVSVRLTLNGRDMGIVALNEDGTFTKDIELFEEGDQELIVTAADKGGTKTTITRNFYYSTGVPVISSVVIEPNPIDHGATYTIRVEVQ
ncbi:MAG: hypothetical protein IJ766_05000 [Clostridia bacterium]|nr:hypothetical protein [Clostridia bacterium]